MTGHTRWSDLKRTRIRESAAARLAPTVLVKVERDGWQWIFRKWGPFGQAESLDAVEGAARDLIGTAVGIAVVVDACEAADEAARQGT